VSLLPIRSVTVPQYRSTEESQCQSAAVLQSHSVTVPQYRRVTVSQCRNTAELQCHSAAVPQSHSAAVPQSHSAAVPQCRNSEVPLCHSAAVMQCHSAAVKQCRRTPVSQCRRVLRDRVAPPLINGYSVFVYFFVTCSPAVLHHVRLVQYHSLVSFFLAHNAATPERERRILVSSTCRYVYLIYEPL